jgi:hypothetical protein
MNFVKNLLFMVLALTANAQSLSGECSTPLSSKNVIIPQNNCISFSVGSGTGCDWMCNYCATNLGTNNYYFTTDVCKYQSGGCVGNPQAGVTYTCCSA